MWAFKALFISLPVTMAQSNYIDNVLKGDRPYPIQDEIISNSVLLADMAASSDYQYRYISPSEINIAKGSGYSVKLEGDNKFLYKDGVKCEPDVDPARVISEIKLSWGNSSPFPPTLGTLVSDHYTLHMSTDHSFQFYKRNKQPSEADEEDTADNVANSTQLEKRYGFRCVNKKFDTDATCGNKLKSGNKIASAHNCGGKGYQCDSPQGPEGDTYGTCCYSIKTAKKCGFEGGYCFLDKVKNTCGEDCLN